MRTMGTAVSERRRMTNLTVRGLANGTSADAIRNRLDRHCCRGDQAFRQMWLVRLSGYYGVVRHDDDSFHSFLKKSGTAGILFWCTRVLIVFEVSGSRGLSIQPMV